ncbi:unnamed protein product [Peronospora belbahrii]|uniref:Tyrosine specific protein phosphatases domain-containing protein n=1 Tax=Peronospora belbahrii TaxID=622444 RepID=A0AAU9LKZ3_9STRA|nr:unnamed protein product [Peronospora belbahrii]CAH0515875.1 unnamed protein product [Peronospora belbahrii]
MLTNFIERKRVKADLYWDTCLKKAVEFGGIRVILLEEEEEESSSLRVGYIMRRFQICQVNDKGQEGESRVIRHLQLTTWPDHGAIRDFQVIAPILDAMNRYRCEASRMYHGVETRVIVHCSAGIGRSGTFIAIDILYRQLHQVLTDKSDNVEEKTRALQHAMNIPRVVYHLRSQRPGMVQTPEQYEMIYQHVAAVISGSQSW